jgi:hypothetical protein
MKATKSTAKKILAIRCPTCGAAPGEKCELSTGLPRTNPHRYRRLIAADSSSFSFSLGSGLQPRALRLVLAIRAGPVPRVL